MLCVCIKTLNLFLNNKIKFKYFPLFVLLVGLLVILLEQYKRVADKLAVILGPLSFFYDVVFDISSLTRNTSLLGRHVQIGVDIVQKAIALFSAQTFA